MAYNYTPDDQQPIVEEYVLPQDGDPAVVSSVNTAFQGLADNVAFLFLMLGPIANVANYGADGTGVADSSPAVALALAAIPDGGTLFFPDGTWSLSATVLLPKGVSVVGSPNAKVRMSTNSTFLEFDVGSASSVAVAIANLEVDATVATTLPVIVDPAGVKCVMSNVRIGTSLGNVQGAHLVVSTTGEWDLVDCYSVKGTSSDPCLNVYNGATLRVHDCTLTSPLNAAWAGRYVSWGSPSYGGIWDSTIDTNGANDAGSSPTCLLLTTGVIVDGNTFRSPNDGSAKAFTWSAGTYVNIGVNSYVSFPYPWGARLISTVCPRADEASIITWRSQYRHSSASVSYILYDGYDSYVVVSSGTNPTIYLPTPRAGKTVTVFLVNATASPWAGPVYDDAGSTTTGDAVIATERQLTVWTAVDETADTYRWALVTSRTY